MKLLSVYHVGLLLGLAGISMGAKAGVLGPTSHGTISISVTIAPHVVVREASRPAQVAGGAPHEALCVGNSGLMSYRASLLIRIDGRPKAIDLPVVHRDQLREDQLSCGHDAGAGATVRFDQRALQEIRGSTEQATLLIIPD